MKADYKNWMPKGIVTGTGCGMIASLVLFLILGVSPIVPEGSAKRVLGIKPDRVRNCGERFHMYDLIKE